MFNRKVEGKKKFRARGNVSNDALWNGVTVCAVLENKTQLVIAIEACRALGVCTGCIVTPTTRV